MKRLKTMALAGAAVAIAAGGGVAVILGNRDASAPQTKFESTDITGAPWGGSLELTDHHGRRRTLTDFRGKVVMVFFGYTNCPDACPLALAEMAQVVSKLGADGARVQGLFISVDPTRDTQEQLAAYVPAFHPSFLGLRGSPEETDRAAKNFKIYFRAASAASGAHSGHGGDGNYMVDHSTGIYILDTEGRPRLYVSANNRSTESMVRDIRGLLARPGSGREKPNAS